MRCADCPALEFTPEQLSEIRGRFPDFQQRAICCCDEAKLAEERMYKDLDPQLAKLKASEMQDSVYRGPPRNRAERRAAAAQARHA